MTTFPLSASGFAGLPQILLIVSFILPMEPLLIRRIGDPWGKSVRAILPSPSAVELHASGQGLECGFSDTEGNHGCVQGIPTAVVKKLAM